MKKFAFVAMSIAAVISSNAFAQAKTRAQVYQELIEARQNGLDFVTDASYPDVDPMFREQVAGMKAQAAHNAMQAQAKSHAADAME
ncbi:DUF4148 domain-containing protein [Trinickia sp.]|uniref:DUF4148 domain-containing protein n=1 Tax=Trinickia sp. TaxID=2571163 RepID=UPI003F811004